jgi:hypothetical protein
MAVLLLATPVFGLALQPPSITPLLRLSVSASSALIANLDATSQASESTMSAPAPVMSADTAPAGPAASTQDTAAADADYAAKAKRRNSLIKLHRPLGIATWSAMTVTLVLGTIQYYNLYGFFADQGSNPCVEGNAVFGQGQCTGIPWPHAIAAGVTTALYATTFTVSLMMPDPDDLAAGKGEFASTLRLHKLLRWVHFGGMVAQGLLGLVVANGMFGLDRANDYGTLQALATVHLATGVVTYGALTWAGALMTF